MRFFVLPTKQEKNNFYYSFLIIQNNGKCFFYLTTTLLLLEQNFKSLFCKYLYINKYMAYIIKEEQLDEGHTNYQHNIKRHLLHFTHQNCVIKSCGNAIKLTLLTRVSKLHKLSSHIHVENGEICIKSFFLENDRIWVIQSYEQRKNLFRAFLKTSLDPYAKIIVNKEGQVEFKIHTFFAKGCKVSNSKEIPKFLKLLKAIYSEYVQIITKFFPELLRILKNVFSSQTQRSNDKLIEKMDFLKSTEGIMNKKLIIERKKVNDEEFHIWNPISSMMKSIEIYTKNTINQDNCKRVYAMKFWGIKKQYEDSKEGFSQQIGRQTLDRYLPFLKVPKLVTNFEICPLITICNSKTIEWKKLIESKETIISKAHVFFHLVPLGKPRGDMTIHQNPTQRTMVLKVSKQNGYSRDIEWEYELLRNVFKKKACPFIAQYYCSNEKIAGEKKFILSEYYKGKSLDMWLNSSSNFTSIFSKVVIMTNIIYGLKFLHSGCITHMDLKPGNVLMDRNMVTKLIDFGEAHHPGLQQSFKMQNKKYNPGYTLPYAPIEVFEKELKITTAADIFSLGVMIFEIVFTRDLFGSISQRFLRSNFFQQANSPKGKNQENLLESTIYFAPESIEYSGCERILTALLKVMWKCIDRNPSRRPDLNWLLISIKEIYHLLLNFHSL